MVEFDPLMAGVVVGLMGLLLWIVTNWHLVRTGKAIKADIDEKRAGTEAFVREELEGLKEELREAKPAVDIKAELEGLESRLGTVQIDAAPLIAQVEATLIPAVQERVENVKSAILGSLGYAKKGMKALGEGAAKLTGEKALEAAGFESEWEMRLAQFGMDDEWMKNNKAAAFGLSLIKSALNKGENPQAMLLGGNAQAEGKAFPTVYGR